MHAEVCNLPLFLLLLLFTTGLLSAVSDINTEQINSSSIVLSFKAPPTLLGVPINHYAITISSTDLQMNHSLITNSTRVVLHLQDVCSKYWISISSWNDVGEGETTTFSTVLNACKYDHLILLKC